MSNTIYQSYKLKIGNCSAKYYGVDKLGNEIQLYSVPLYTPTLILKNEDGPHINLIHIPTLSNVFFMYGDGLEIVDQDENPIPSITSVATLQSYLKTVRRDCGCCGGSSGDGADNFL